MFIASPGNPILFVFTIAIQYSLYVGFKIITAVIVKSIILWHKMPRSPVENYRRFGRTCFLYLQDLRQSQAATNKLFAWFILQPYREKRRRVISFTPPATLFLVKSCRYPIDRKPRGLQDRSGHCGVDSPAPKGKKNQFSQPSIS
jgi:hypothetical protein